MHDMGGFGPLLIEEVPCSGSLCISSHISSYSRCTYEPVFHAAWEARVHSVEELTHYRTGGHGPEPVGLCCMQSDFTPAVVGSA